MPRLPSIYLCPVFPNALPGEYHRNLWEGETLTGVCSSSPVFASILLLIDHSFAVGVISMIAILLHRYVCNTFAINFI